MIHFDSCSHNSIILFQCSCRWRSLKLPSYSKYDPSPVPDGVAEDGPVDMGGIGYRGRLRSHLDQTDCACGIPMEELLGFEDEFDDAQRVCSSVLMREELQAAIDTRNDWTARPPSDPSVQSQDFNENDQYVGVGVDPIERPNSDEDEASRLQKARQSYNQSQSESS